MTGIDPMDGKQERRKTGRPTLYTAELAVEICDLLAGGQTLVRICERDDMPHRATVIRWLGTNPGFRDLYAKAREIQMEHLGEELLEIADDGRNDWMQQTSADGENLGWRLNGEHVNRSRLRVDTRKWLMSKLAPRKYGDKVSHTGPEGGAIQTEDVTLDDVERAKRLAALLDRARARRDGQAADDGDPADLDPSAGPSD